MTSPYLLVSYTKAFQVKVKSETFENLNWHTMCQKYQSTISFYKQPYKFSAYVCCEKSTSKIIFRMPCHLLTNSTISVLFALTLFDTERTKFISYSFSSIWSYKGREISISNIRKVQDLRCMYPKFKIPSLNISKSKNLNFEYLWNTISLNTYFYFFSWRFQHIAHPLSFRTNNYDTFSILKKIRCNFIINLQNRK